MLETLQVLIFWFGLILLDIIILHFQDFINMLSHLNSILISLISNFYTISSNRVVFSLQEYHISFKLVIVCFEFLHFLQLMKEFLLLFGAYNFSIFIILFLLNLFKLSLSVFNYVGLKAAIFHSSDQVVVFLLNSHKLFLEFLSLSLMLFSESFFFDGVVFVFFGNVLEIFNNFVFLINLLLNVFDFTTEVFLNLKLLCNLSI